MQLNHEQLVQLVAQARNDAPNETCGIIAGAKDRARKIYALKNVHATPQVGYTADPPELLAALQDTEALGLEMLAIYHSHPASPAYPSPTDIARALYPAAVYVVISLMNHEQTTVRGFRIVDGIVSEITLEVEETTDESPRTHPRRPAGRANRPNARRSVAALSQRRPASGNTRGARRRVSK